MKALKARLLALSGRRLSSKWLVTAAFVASGTLSSTASAASYALLTDEQNPAAAQPQQPATPPAPDSRTNAATAPVSTSGDRKFEPLRLVRCYYSNELGCFRVIGDLSSTDFTADSASFRARLDSAALVGPGLVRAGLDNGGTLNLLIVYDVSGSMKGERMAYTRAAVHNFIEDLPGNVSTSVVSFDSRNVHARFDAARFESSTGANEQLGRIPSPTNGNTALYSAIVDGLATLDKNAASAQRSIMLVITDGINDVRPEKGDDPGLLKDTSGMNVARNTIAGSKHNVWLVGAGFPDSTVLKYLAGETGRARFSEIDPVQLSRLLKAILAEMTPTRMMVYAIPSAPRSDLGRRRRSFQVAALKESSMSWRPPLVALPPFEGDADSTLLRNPEVERMADEMGSALNQRLMVFIPLLVLLVFAHWAMPRLIGAPQVSSATVSSGARDALSSAGAPERAAPTKAVPKPPAAIQLRPLTEAPPRTPDDITKDAAR